MSITAIPSLPSTTPSVSGSSGDSPAPQPLQAAANAAGDTIQLSEAQRVYQLYNQGLPVSEIADSLSLSVAAVNHYLNLSAG